MYKIDDTKHSYLELFVCKTFLVFVFYVFFEVLSKLMFDFARVFVLGFMSLASE
jgi:hypothetical protein